MPSAEITLWICVSLNLSGDNLARSFPKSWSSPTFIGREGSDREMTGVALHKLCAGINIILVELVMHSLQLILCLTS